jgi:membrane fusion protein (multidrug efflux system)
MIVLALTLMASGLPAVAQQQGLPPAAVTVMTMQPQDVPLTTTLPGRVLASAQAEVRPQVAGIITDRKFDEGGRVEEGDVLYTIDAATYEAAVAQANAAVAQANAQLKSAQKEEARLQELQSRNVASEQALDGAVAARDIAAAAVQAAKAQLQTAQIQLDRTRIRARLSGEIGRSLTSRGALVTASQAEPLAVIRKIDPVYVDVTQSAADIIAWRRDNIGTRLEDVPAEVTLKLADGSVFDQIGTLTAAEPDVNEQTGVVVLRMQFANPDKLLLPGMYVQVEIATTTAKGVYLVPQPAISRDRRGQPTAMIVGPDNVVEMRQLSIIGDHENDWVVNGGLNPGDRVVVVGLQKAAPGATVTPQEQSPVNAASAPAANE